MSARKRKRAAPARNAGIVSRSIAAVLDLIAVLLGLVGLYLGIAFIRFIVDVRNFSFPTVPWVFTTTGFVVACVLYLTLCWSAFGRTIGQLLMGLRVRSRRSGRNVHLIVAFGRALFCTVFPLGLAWVVFSPTRRSLQDLALHTEVVYADHRP